MASASSDANVISVQWQLNELTGSAVAIAKGVLRAATSDNVQPIAIISADAFGATLAMCLETQMKVESLAKRHHTSYVAEFLKSSIGYAKDDCATQLCSTSTGVRFLGLAAALLCTSDIFTASQTLEALIASSAASGQILPTTTQLRDLLAALEYKMNRAGFSDNVVGWETFLTEHPEIPSNLKSFCRLSLDHPSTKAIQAMVECMRTLDRIGEATTSVQIKAGTCCPWVVAFIKWCLGTPPKVILEDGTILVDQPSTRVTVVCAMTPTQWVYNRKDASVHDDVKRMQAREVDVEIYTYSHLEEPGQVLKYAAKDQQLWVGMLPIQVYGRRRLKDFDLLGNKAFFQAISYSVGLVTSKLQAHHPQHRPPSTGMQDLLRSDDEWTGPLPNALSKYKITLFPGNRDLRDTLNKFMDLSDSSDAVLAQLKEGQRLMDLPLVELYLRNLQENCKCEACSGDLGERLAQCLKNEFIDHLTQLTAEVIALSLFNTTEPVLVHSGGGRSPGVKSLDRNMFINAVQELVCGQTSASCPAMEIIRLSLDLVGHRAAAKANARDWIASAARGQVVFLHLFDATLVSTRAILTLGGAPGKLFHDGSHFDKVLGGTGRQWDTASKSKSWDEVPVDRVLNLIPGEELQWEVRKGDGALYLGCGTTNTPKSFNPHHILEALAQSLILQNCPHRDKSTLTISDKFCFYITPLYSEIGFNRPGSRFANRIGVVAVAENDGLRLLAFSSGRPGLLRGKACLQCCLDLSREAGMRYIVL